LNHPPSIGEAIVVQCHRCGASLTPTQLGAVGCAHCGHRQALDPHTSARLAHYLQRFATAQGHVVRERTEAEKYERWAQHGSTRNSYILTIGFVWMCGFPLVLAHLWEQRVLTEPAARGIGIGIGVLTVAVMAFLMWPKDRTRRAASAPGASLVSCPTCGAGNPFRHGSAATVCRYCTTTLLASGDVVCDGLDAARRNVRLAELRRLRAERSHYVSDDVFEFRVWALVALSMGVGMPVVSAVNTIVGGGGPVPLAVPLVAAGVALTGIAGWMIRRWRHISQLRNAVDELATRVHGVAQRHPTATVAWLNAFWPALFDMDVLGTTKRFGAVSAVVDGFAVHVFHATSASTPARLSILVAAWLPDISDGCGPGPAAPPATYQAILQAGFRLANTPAGICLTASQEAADQVGRDPHRMIQLTTTLTQAAQLTRTLGGVPVGALPA